LQKKKQNYEWTKFVKDCTESMKGIAKISGTDESGDWNKFAPQLTKVIREYNDASKTNTQATAASAPTQKVKTNNKNLWSNLHFRYLAAVVAVCIVTLSIVLPLTLPNRGNGSGGGSLGGGGSGGGDDILWQASESRPIYDLDDFYNRIGLRNILFFDRDFIDDFDARAFYVTDKYDENFVASYFIDDLIVSTQCEIYFFDVYRFRIVLEDVYEFEGIENYDEQYLSNQFDVNGVQGRFQIDTNLNRARIAFEYGGYEYFITLFGSSDVVTVVTEPNLLILLNDLIGN